MVRVASFCGRASQIYVAKLSDLDCQRHRGALSARCPRIDAYVAPGCRGSSRFLSALPSMLTNKNGNVFHYNSRRTL